MKHDLITRVSSCIRAIYAFLSNKSEIIFKVQVTDTNRRLQDAGKEVRKQCGLRCVMKTREGQKLVFDFNCPVF